jgi:aspartyl-tRNA(Asn)/glutamyl-tRNA(Gln) amidotransferase subunit C
MELDDSTLDRIAELARLDVSDPAKRAELLSGMQRILDFIQKLETVDTTGVEPLIFLTEEENVMREDVATPQLSKQEALMNHPQTKNGALNREGDYFKVPRVVDKG